MTSLIIAVIAVAAVWVLAYTGAPLIAWTGVLAVAFAASALTGFLGPVGLSVLGAVLVGFAFFTLKPLRKSLVTAPIFAGFKKVLPEMSEKRNAQTTHPQVHHWPADRSSPFQKK